MKPVIEIETMEENDKIMSEETEDLVAPTFIPEIVK